MEDASTNSVPGLAGTGLAVVAGGLASLPLILPELKILARL